MEVSRVIGFLISAQNNQLSKISNNLIADPHQNHSNHQSNQTQFDKKKTKKDKKTKMEVQKRKIIFKREEIRTGWSKSVSWQNIQVSKTKTKGEQVKNMLHPN